MRQWLHLEAMIDVALEAHRGQVDKAGAPYILHPLRVMLSVIEAAPELLPEVAWVAVLHDVVEDTNVTLADLEECGVGGNALDAIQLLTRDPVVPYDQYVAALAGNALARAVKVADLQDNLGRNSELLPKCLRDRYERALAALQEATP